MPDVETPAESSPAAPAPQPQQSSAEERQPPEVLAIPTDPGEYAEWRQTGKLPGKSKPSREAPAPSEPKSAGEEPEKAAPASDAGIKRQGRSNADTRKEELNREIRDLLEQRDRIRQEVESHGKKDVKAAEPSPAPANTDGEPVQPKEEDFSTWQEYKAAEKKYLGELTRWAARQAVLEHVQKQYAENEKQTLRTKLEEAKQRYGEEADTKIVATATELLGSEGVPDAIRAAINRSPVVVDALYVVGSDKQKFSEFLHLVKTDPLEALREWFTVEALVKQELAKSSKSTESETPARGADGKFLPEKPVRPRIAPPTELNGNSSPPGDERQRAAESGDFRSFKQAADRRDMLRFKGQL